MTPLLLWLLLFAPSASPDAQLRQALQTKTGAVALPAGEFEITRELTLPPDAHDLTIDGSKTAIKAAATFRGRALIAIPGGTNIHITGLTLDGNRDAVSHPTGLPPSGTTFARFTPNNGILAENVTGDQPAALQTLVNQWKAMTQEEKEQFVDRVAVAVVNVIAASALLPIGKKLAKKAAKSARKTIKRQKKALKKAASAKKSKKKPKV